MCCVEVRRARPEDEPARANILQDAFGSYFFDTFIYFYFQEVTLQGVVLGGAVLFIFCGASVSACCLLPLAAAVVVAIGVAFSHAGASASALRILRVEDVGWVATRGGRIIGTVSLDRTNPGAGRMRALAVYRLWRRKGAGAALASTVRTYAYQSGFAELEARVSYIQTAARSLLHKQGWELRASYVRPVAGGLMELPMALLGLDLPAA